MYFSGFFILEYVLRIR